MALFIMGIWFILLPLEECAKCIKFSLHRQRMEDVLIIYLLFILFSTSPNLISWCCRCTFAQRCFKISILRFKKLNDKHSKTPYRWLYINRKSNFYDARETQWHFGWKSVPLKDITVMDYRIFIKKKRNKQRKRLCPTATWIRIFCAFFNSVVALI